MIDLTRVARRLRGRTNKIHGDHAQEIVAYRLRAMGLEMVEHIATPWRIHRAYDPKSGRSRIMGATPMEKVSSDFTAVVPKTGQSVRCEVKRRSDDVLSLSDFDGHQKDALTLHAALGGISLCAWVFETKVEVLDWVKMALAKGKPLHIGDEERIAPMRWRGV